MSGHHEEPKRSVPMLKRALLALAACVGLAPFAAHSAIAELPPIDRVAEIRQRLLKMDEAQRSQSGETGNSKRGGLIAQWINWPNVWGNWPNWGNWNNWNNWGNWRNW